jgi:hypothetical protein
MALFGAATLAANAFWIALFLYVGRYSSIRVTNNPSPGYVQSLWWTAVSTQTLRNIYAMV